MLEKYLNIHPEVQKSISFGYPVVALESHSIINTTNYPKNIEVSNKICEIIRNNGAIPATTAIINGILKVGLTEEELNILLTNSKTQSASITDLPFAISHSLTCTTTLSSAITIANLANINVLLTNKINGIFKTNYNQIQVPSDLQKLCSNEIFIISNKVNTDMDLDITLNYLESHNIIVLNNKAAKYKINSTSEISKIFKIKKDLNLDGGFLIINSNLIVDSDENSHIKQLYINAELASKIARDISLICKN
ncbi:MULTISPECIES: pseudouridine-5'-phosphate glycosidase [unclassified Romboutsia]|uniref:pseudouridine-5'-phosphate glycosidase n=1 Tax=unclassified Romboutsia TaxID=2626894 RepID=UPI0008221DCA|nr:MULTISPECIES: pseudouridine-5'-phosphate glycosidase [unclassified Romboutsia]SCI30822.1 Pseudouridine-5'-phosphate glycosidase [uncultured Clostridium sp.]